jgi:hypothetical protein
MRLQVTLIIVLATCSQGTRAEELTRLMLSFEKLENRLTANQETYFLGEAVTLKFVTRNNSHQTVSIPHLERMVGFGLGMSRIEGDRKVSLNGPIEDIGFGQPRPEKALTLRPGQEKALTLSSIPFDYQVARLSGLPEGAYNVTLAGASIRITFVAPILERVERLQLRKFHTVEASSGYPPETKPYYRWILALRYINDTYLCVTTVDDRFGFIRFEESLGKSLSEDLARDFRLYKRITTLPNQLQDLKATIEPLDNIDITWTDAAGNPGRIVLNPETLEPI